MKSLLIPAALLVVATLSYCNWRNGPERYQYPLHLDPELAANFGEVRQDHFHMGLDMRTFGQENIPVYAADDGHVSRITVTEDEYGLALYIAHRNGTTTLYGHLNRLSPPLQQFLRGKQDARKRWQQDIKLADGKFPVRKNELIAYSGNTGHSEGPHLHFEIIDTKSGDRLNPLLNGMQMDDDLSPSVKNVYWYDRRYSIYNTSGALLGKPVNDKLYKITSPYISLGIEATDKNASTKYTLGIYRAELYMDDELQHFFAFDKIGEKDTRYVNGCVDYEKMMTLGQRIQYLFRLPGNHLPAYRRSSSNGMLDISDGKTHEMRIKVFDAAGNTETLQFKLQFVKNGAVPRSAKKGVKAVLPNKSTNIQSAHADISFGKNTFYDTVPLLVYEEAAKSAGAASPLIRLRNSDAPVHDEYSVSIRTSLAPNDPLRKRTVMYMRSVLGNQAIAGRWIKNSMSGSFDRLGDIQLITDVVPPAITLKNSGRAQQRPVLRVACADNLGTIASFSAELNGRWVPFAKKGNEFTYAPGSLPKPGKLTVTVSDVAGNKTTSTFDL